MGWHDFLRLERKRKLERIRILGSGRNQVATNNEERRRSIESEIIADLRSQIAEIEQLLNAAGEPFEV